MPQEETIDHMSEAAIRRQLLSDAVQRPSTLLPLGAAAGSVIYLVLLSPLFGGGRWAAVALAGFGVVAVASLALRYLFGYGQAYDAKLRALAELQSMETASLEHRAFTQLRETLQAGFEAIGSAAGIATLSGLFNEYQALHAAVERSHEVDPLSSSPLASLARESYRRGLSVLSDALELMQATAGPGRDNLVRDIAALESVAEAPGGDEVPAARRRLEEERLASHKQRLALLDKLLLSADGLCFQAGRCEASLHRTRIEISALRAGYSERGVDSVVQALYQTIDQVKEVQDELKRLGY